MLNQIITNHMLEEKKKHIDDLIKHHRVVLFMKGSKELAQCGFSAKVCQILAELDVDFTTQDVLQDPTLRQAIKEYSDWPTLPQLYVNGQFIGGCDIVMQMHENGDLKTVLSASK